MSDERNADSVLFQLDTLSAMQSQKKPGGAPRQLARLAAPTPQSEAGSGLIDLRTLGGNPGALEESAEAAPLGAELATSAELSQSTLLSSSSMSATVSRANGAQVPGVPAQLPSRTPLILLSVLALVALAAAVTAIILRG